MMLFSQIASAWRGLGYLPGGTAPVSEYPAKDHAAEIAIFMKFLTLLCVGVAAVTFALGVAVLWQARTDAWNQAVRSSQNLALTLADEIGRTITVYDLSLQGTAEAVALPGLDEVRPAIRRSALFDRASAAPYLNSILWIDANGDLVAEARSSAPRKLNLADRDYFLDQRAHPNLGLRIARAIVSRLNPEEAILELSRRIPAPDSQFNGIVSGGLRLSYFHDLFGKLTLGAHGSITLVHMTGHIVYRWPAPPAIDQDVSKSPVFARYSTATAGYFTERGQLYDRDRLYAFQRIGNLPLTISVGVSLKDIYEAWWPKAMAIGSIIGLLCVAILFLGFWVRREMERRLVVEKELGTLALTDGLTGIMNRRGFDLMLDTEWKSAVRRGAPISLLMLDADWFKLYNDHYGHQAGDEVLRLVARSIQNNLRRSRDIAARIGGEEFAVLLPDTEGPGALEIAEHIRTSVAGRRLPHAPSVLGHVSVSIGIATHTPLPQDSSSAFVHCADEALYAAKTAGRNQLAVSKRSPVTQHSSGGEPINF